MRGRWARWRGVALAIALAMTVSGVLAAPLAAFPSGWLRVASVEYDSSGNAIQNGGGDSLAAAGMPMAAVYAWDATNSLFRRVTTGGTGSGVNTLKVTIDAQTIASADARSNSVTQLSSGGAAQSTIPVRNETYNGTTWDRPRSSAVTTGVQLSTSENSLANITTNASTAVKTSAGVLHYVVINTKGAASNTVTVNNAANCNAGTAQTTVATIDSTVDVTSLRYDASMSSGICVVTATGTAPNLTVVYR